MTNYYGLIELVLVYGSVFGFGFWQLYALRRDKRARARDHGDKAAPPES